MSEHPQQSQANAPALAPMTGSLPPHYVRKERIPGSLNGHYWRIYRKDNHQPVVRGIIGETLKLAKENALAAIKEANVPSEQPADTNLNRK